MTEQRWLTLDGISTVLGLSRPNILWLAKKGYLTCLPGKTRDAVRYLDPTPEHANKLRLAEALYGRRYPIPSELERVPLLTLCEIGEIMGWSKKAQQNALYKQRGVLRGKGRIVGKYRLFSVEEVRDALWKKQGKRIAHQRAPFLITHLVEFFLKRCVQADDGFPTDAEIAEDDDLMRRLDRISKMSPLKQDAAMTDLVQKIDAAKKLAAQITKISDSQKAPSSAA